MAQPSGHWLAYLQFDYRGEVRVLHLLCDNRAQLDEVLSLLKDLPPDSGELVEYAIFQSGRNISVREAPNFPERHILTYAQFITRWRTAAGTPSPAGGDSGPWPAPLGRVFGTRPDVKALADLTSAGKRQISPSRRAAGLRG